MQESPKTLISAEEMDNFLFLRKRIFELIKRSLKLDGHCKSYEGALSIHWPNYFEDSTGVMRIELACYVLGGSRHSSWEGKTLSEAIVKMDQDVDRWEHEISHFSDNGGDDHAPCVLDI